MTDEALEFEWPDFGPEIAKAAGKEGWLYKDVGWMANADWRKFEALAGEGNVQWLVWTERGDTRRGQILVSPSGVDRLKAHHVSASQPLPPLQQNGVKDD